MSESEALTNRIRGIIQNKEKISVKSSRINSDLEKYVHFILSETLNKFGQIRYLDMLYTILKELAINGIKANQKRIFFEENGLNIMDETQYAEGLVKFKASFSDEMAEEYGEKCRKRGVFCQLDFFFTEHGMYIECVNNTPILPAEEKRLREKMKKSMAYDSIAEFYMDNMDNTEGAGLGIAMTMILLKNEGIDPNLFRIVTKPDKTLARIEVPFTSDYVTFRDKGKKA